MDFPTTKCRSSLLIRLNRPDRASASGLFFYAQKYFQKNLASCVANTTNTLIFALSNRSHNKGKIMNEKKETILFRAYYNGFAYIGEAQIECTKGAGITDETGYTDEDEIFAELLEVWNEDAGIVISPAKLFAAENAPFRRAMEQAAFDEFYNPTSSEKLFPGEGN